jgi:hypothetical protein
MRRLLTYRPVMDKVIRVQGSGFRIHRGTVDSGQWSVVGAKPQAVSVHNSSLIFRPSGYTLVEILIATALTLLLMGVVVQLFGALGQSITDSRSTLESSERLRSAAARLQMDLAGVTVTMLPPRDPADGEGYFEYIEGPVMQGFDWSTNPPQPNDIRPRPVNSEAAGSPLPLDSTVGDFDDILMFTTRSKGKQFIGTYNGSTAVQSDVAEVAWFIRGRTLYRRQLLIRPDLAIGVTLNTQAAGFYASNDISVRQESGFKTNTLSDLTRRECRFGHPTGQFPFDARYWGQLALPTLRECSQSAWTAGIWSSGSVPTTWKDTVDFWSNDTSWRYADSVLGNGSRIADDVILTNVIGFDVKAWDPGANGGAGGYVDLGNMLPSNPSGYFTNYGVLKSGLQGSANTPRVYDTWSTHYENIGLAPGYTNPGQGVNGFDDNNDGIVDDENEKLTSPPYPYPLRGIQIKIRVFEPDSRQIQEVTIVQDFLPK